MAREKITADDLSLVNRVLRQHPDVEEIVRAVKQVSANAKYPINTFDELAKAMGGEDATVTFRGRSMKVAEARRFIPAYYFPIGSEDDLVAKISDLQERARVGAPPAPVDISPGLTVHWAEPKEKPAGLEPPKVTAEELASLATKFPGTGSGIQRRSQ